MIDITSERTLSLSQAARLLPPGRRNRPCSLSCVLRWILSGTKGPNGDVVRLEALRLGSRWLTSHEAIQRFAERLTPRLGDTGPAPRTIKRRQRACDRAAKELAKVGI